MRQGFSVVEVLVALLLTGLLVGVAWGVVARSRAGLARMVERSELLQAETAVWGVIGQETRRGRRGRDWEVPVAGRLELRAFRGLAAVCGPGRDGGSEWPVRYRGWRSPNPAKDSVLLLTGTGRWSVAALVGRDPGTCRAEEGRAWPPGHPGGEREELWRLSPVPSGRPLLMRLFERGSYHLEDGALRYRRGGAGRQPLTGEVLDPGVPGLQPGGPGTGVRVRFRPHAGLSPDTGWVRRIGGGSTR